MQGSGAIEVFQSKSNNKSPIDVKLSLTASSFCAGTPILRLGDIHVYIVFSGNKYVMCVWGKKCVFGENMEQLFYNG